MPQLPPLAGKGASAWHTMLVGGQALPGVVTLSGSKGYKVDKKPGLGEDGGTTTIQGREIPSVELTLRTYKPEHVEELAGWLKILFPSGSDTPDPFVVSHPALAMLGITTLFFEKCSVPVQMPAPEQTRIEVRFTCSETRTAKPMSGGTKSPTKGIDTSKGQFGKKQPPPKATGKTPPKVTIPKPPKFFG